MDCSWPGSSVHGISQARMLEWFAISISRGSFQPRDQTHISYIGNGFFTTETGKMRLGFPILNFLLVKLYFCLYACVYVYIYSFVAALAQYLCVYDYLWYCIMSPHFYCYVVFIHLPVNGHLGCFHFWLHEECCSANLYSVLTYLLCILLLFTYNYQFCMV